MEYPNLSQELETVGLNIFKLEHALSQASDVEILSALEKLLVECKLVTFENGIPVMRKEDQEWGNGLIHELMNRFKLRIKTKEPGYIEPQPEMVDMANHKIWDEKPLK